MSQPILRRAVRVAVVLAVLIGAGVGAWKGWVEPRFVPKRWGVVAEGKIYRSGQLSPYLVKSTLARHGIQVVVDLTGEDPASHEQRAEREAMEELGIRSQRCPLVGDGTGDVAQYEAALRALESARRSGQPALVHCSAGSQRTGGVIAAYRLLFERAAPDEVLAEMQHYGWRPGRDEVLREYLNTHLDELAQRLARDGCLAEVPRRLPRL